MRDLGVPAESIAAEGEKLIKQQTDAFFSLIRTYDKPIVGFTYRSLQEQMVRNLLELGVPIYQDPDRAARSIAAVIQYYKMRDHIGDH
jgi:acyl-CoA synthetase (NDP forming)